MPVDTPNEAYTLFKDRWVRCRDAVAGSDAVKKRKRQYLPGLSEQNDSEYEAYLTRANFYGAAGRTHLGLLGAIFRKDPEIKGLEKRATLSVDGRTATEVIKAIASDVLTVGRIGVLVDFPTDGGAQANIATYRAEDCISWRTTVVNGISVLDRVVLEESFIEPDINDPFIDIVKTQWRELALVDGLYVQNVWREGASVAGTASRSHLIQEIIEPLRKGKRLDFIPFIFVNTDSGTPAIAKPPLLDVVDVNLSHFRTSADLEHGAHFTALPTAYVAGFPTDKVLRMGSSVAWISTNPQAKAGFLEYTGQGLGALSTLMQDKEQMMAALGARILEDSKRAVESADALEIRQSGEQGALSGIVVSISAALSTAFGWLAWWDGASSLTSVEVQLNMDFIALRMPADELTALMKTMQGGGMSKDSFLWNLKRGEMLPPDRTIDQEIDLIDKDAPVDDAGIIPPKKAISLVKDASGVTIGAQEV